ncbi:hypothetical protein NE686_17950 [Tissierella carlieri]|uniref:Uncharacterized protein n=1 Tax=Tissierella carlieri TaxID=689904 RepID=A0ABT1SF04_9FIRM|nr:hypothetical protein [Tissierella carlieri]MCQ4924989.1 hypothetical protein [Tissierella carlieri]
MINAMEGYVTPKGLKFTVVGITINGQEIAEQEGILTQNMWGEIKVGDVGVFDSFFGKCEVIEVFERETLRGWFVARRIYD